MAVRVWFSAKFCWILLSKLFANRTKLFCILIGGSKKVKDFKRLVFKEGRVVPNA